MATLGGGVKKTALADPSAATKLRKAAKAAGVDDLGELAVLLADAGFLKASNPFELEEVTIAEVGGELWRRIEGAEDVPIAFGGLMPQQQAAVVCHLVHGGQATIRVASRLGVPLETIQRTWRKHCESIGRGVIQMRLDSLIGHVTARAEQIYELALEPDEKGRRDLKTAQSVTFELVRMLQSLGIVQQSAQKIDVSVTHTVQEEIKSLLDIERKEKESLKFLETEGEDEGPRGIHDLEQVVG